MRPFTDVCGPSSAAAREEKDEREMYLRSTSGTVGGCWVSIMIIWSAPWVVHKKYIVQIIPASRAGVLGGEWPLRCRPRLLASSSSPLLLHTWEIEGYVRGI